MTLDILVKNVALWGTKGLCDLGIAGGKFVSVGQGAATSPAALTLDAGGANGRARLCRAAYSSRQGADL
jgi:cytosine deaminase